MNRFLMIAILVSSCFACGSDVSSYEDAVDAQTDVMTEMISVLEGVNDQASAQKAAGEIEALGNRLAEIAKQVQNLPKPSMEEMREIGEAQQAKTREFQEKATAQMMKLAQYPALAEAWSRAMSSTR